MGDFSELVKNFDKIRDYMRDFYVYGFKSRKDFAQKSLRTYDNEKRRIESYLKDYIRWDTSNGGKRVFVSLDSSKLSENPLYSAWKSKSFTSNDIMLHFYIISALKGSEGLNAEEITNLICEKSEVCFDVQTVRIKANEYVKAGILVSARIKKSLYYSLSKDYIESISGGQEELLAAVKYYQEAAPFGVVGDYILTEENDKNNYFIFKHNFIVHTLEDNILLSVLKAMKEKRSISFISQSKKTGNVNKYAGIPLKIFVSSRSGRRFVNIYNEKRKRFVNYRLDYIKSVDILESAEQYDYFKEKLLQNLPKCWGVSFGDSSRGDIIKLKLYISENEGFIINRLEREGRGGEIKKLEPNVYLYTKEVFDANEVLSWVKTFIGRIISFECTNEFVQNKFYHDMRRMFMMYGDE